MTALLSLVLALGSVAIGGNATWYKYHEGQAAAGPALRDALGPDWRGQTVTVCADRCVVVRLTDWCWCPKGRRVIDLDDDDFAKLAPLSRGVIAVTIEYGGKAIPLPATDTATPDWQQIHEVVM